MDNEFLYDCGRKKSRLEQLKTIVQNSNNHYESDMAMIRIQALEWVQGQIQDIILDHVTTDWPFYDDHK